MFAPSARYGPPESFARFVDTPARGEYRSAARLGAGALSDRSACLARFDGTAL